MHYLTSRLLIQILHDSGPPSFVTPAGGLLHQEAKRMATCVNVASKWKKSYAQTCGFIRARLSFAIIGAASLGLK